MISFDKLSRNPAYGNFCIFVDVGFTKRSALRKSLCNLVEKMHQIDPAGEYSWSEKKSLFKSCFEIIGLQCDTKSTTFFFDVLKTRIPEMKDVNE